MMKVQASMDKQEFRNAMAQLGAAVCVITSDGEAGRTGCTATAVCSVTDDPPTLLLCLNRASRNNAAFRANGTLCVNVLAARQEEIALRFSDPNLSGDQRFSGGDWLKGENGSPALQNAAASIECRISDITEVGTHSIFFCEVSAAHTSAGSDALVYFGRAFHRVGATVPEIAE
jgi:flavin reductase